jgi:GLPGLI family protein
MKVLYSSLIGLSLLCFSSSILAQQSGRIVYHEKFDMHRNIPEEEEMMKSMIPPFMETERLLLFGDNKALYKDYDGESDDISIQHAEDGMDIDIQMEMPETQFFFDFAKGEMIQQQEFFGRDFLITEETPDVDWKITSERKEIQGYDCIKAEYQNPASEEEQDGPGMVNLRSMDAVAWFAPSIPVSAGPMGYGQLPGLILELDLGDGNMVISASSVELGDISEKDLEKPNKGKKVSREEFEAIAAEKMEEMRMEYGGSEDGPGIRMITIETDQ